MTSDIEVRETQRSYKYMQIFEDLKHWIGGTYNIANKLFEQGKEDGLPYEVIRKDIVDVLSGVVSARQLNRCLPDELKRSGGYNSNPRKDMDVYSKTPAQQAIEFKNQMKEPGLLIQPVSEEQPEPEPQFAVPTYEQRKAAVNAELANEELTEENKKLTEQVTQLKEQNAQLLNKVEELQAQNKRLTDKDVLTTKMLNEQEEQITKLWNQVHGKPVATATTTAAEA
jgi:hypothetical protein